MSLKRVAQDGIRVRTRAGAASFRRGATREACLEQAREQIDQAAEHTRVFSPAPKSKDPDTDPHAPKAGDSEAVGAWRKRMGTAGAKESYKGRAATAECVNAQARERGLRRRRVRGTAKGRCVLLHVLAHNPMRTLALAPHLLGYGNGASAETATAT